jgi:AraC-like DNA-binding protein
VPPAANPVRYREQAPHLRLARWVECTWTLESSQPVAAHPVRPDGCEDLIWSPEAGVRIVGTMTREQRFDFSPGAHTCGIRFRPGMAGPFLGLPAAAITDRNLALEEVWGNAGRRVDAAAADAASLPGALKILTAVLRTPSTLNPVQLAIEAMTAAHGDIDLDWVAGQAGLSPRQFRRRCVEESGLTPKHLCRVLRFRRACTLARPPVDWAAIAADAGYFDQSHLIRDFHEFTGATPMSVFSNTHTAPVR